MTDKSGSTSSSSDKRHQRRDEKGRFTDSRSGGATPPERKRDADPRDPRDHRDRDEPPR
ncbi:hypothetical protein [Lysobacter panacisoli]|uniref:hypothetical protein n=1 Tax=Lysobacter panacisoli TaxID=1255263 RepID=UPI00131E98D3|nr:hypothetical protein [Lysobacter panacisoli]